MAEITGRAVKWALFVLSTRKRFSSQESSRSSTSLRELYTSVHPQPTYWLRTVCSSGEASLPSSSSFWTGGWPPGSPRPGSRAAEDQVNLRSEVENVWHNVPPKENCALLRGAAYDG